MLKCPKADGGDRWLLTQTSRMPRCSALYLTRYLISISFKDAKSVGLVSTSSIPADRLCLPSSASAFAVQARMGALLFPVDCSISLIWRVSSYPSISGIWQSVIIKSIGWLCHTVKAGVPDSADFTCSPNNSSCCLSNIRLTGWSSTIKIEIIWPSAFMGDKSKLPLLLSCSCMGCCFWRRSTRLNIGNSTVKVKVEPTLTALSTPSVPFINSARRRQIASPRPVPPYMRAVSAVACS